MEHLVLCKELHLSFEKKGHFKKNCIIRNENQEVVYSTSESNVDIQVKNIKLLKLEIVDPHILTTVHDKNAKEVFQFMRTRDSNEIYSFCDHKKIGYMTKKMLSSKYTVYDCQSNKLLKIKSPSWSGKYADTYQVFKLNKVKVGEIYRKSASSCYSTIHFFGDIDVTWKVLILSATIFLKYAER
ncbi:hypothetical protein HCN44_007566 [Aphidius gifuensis]|uniref:Phospholipid scramblase n=1 Tax=Aphidius gifuensis TaxID=684658 RepID=A0A834XM48_APHGI|nr:hypothetical protein HCN44_007566 [Aphidius gifuensis]